MEATRARTLFFFNATATTEIYTLSLHDALPIYPGPRAQPQVGLQRTRVAGQVRGLVRSEEHTSELQSHLNLVCRLLLEKKKHYLHPLYERAFVLASWQ